MGWDILTTNEEADCAITRKWGSLGPSFPGRQEEDAVLAQRVASSVSVIFYFFARSDMK